MEDTFKNAVVAKLKKEILNACDVIGMQPIMAEIALGLQIIESLDDCETNENVMDYCGAAIPIGGNAYLHNIETGTDVQGFPSVSDPNPLVREVDEAEDITFSEPTEETINLDEVDENGFVKS